ncbi:hypothetical protein [Bacillus sp. OV322]|uniref:hypothetical protein n=1 Tax=Bacillus sp. OV322 TaxID=1882764 RepID=UPI00114D4851|nr:hypothetical protein [Bacillus sp. OV322]
MKKLFTFNTEAYSCDSLSHAIGGGKCIKAFFSFLESGEAFGGFIGIQGMIGGIQDFGRFGVTLISICVTLSCYI